MERTAILIRRLPKFIGVNIIGTVVDTTVLWVFSHYILSGYIGEYIISPIISFECAVLSNYLFSYFGVWKDRAQKHNAKLFAQKYIMYNISSSAVFVFKLNTQARFLSERAHMLNGNNHSVSLDAFHVFFSRLLNSAP